MSEEQNAPISDESQVESQESAENQEQEVLEGSSEEQQASPQEQAELEKLESKKNPTKSEKVRLKQLRLKVDGQEETVDLPFEIDDDPKAVEWMKRQLQMAKMGNRRAQEKSDLEREVSAFIDELRKNPKKALSNPNIGVDVKKLAAEIVEEELENSKKSPEQLEKERLEMELKELKEQRKREQEDKERLEFERLQEKAAVEYDNMISDALESSKSIPKSPYTIQKMANYLKIALENNVDLTPQEILPLVEEDIKRDITEMFKVMPNEVLESMLGKERIAQIRKSRVAAKKAELPPTPFKGSVKDVAKPLPEQTQDAEKITFRKFFGH